MSNYYEMVSIEREFDVEDGQIVREDIKREMIYENGELCVDRGHLLARLLRDDGQQSDGQFLVTVVALADIEESEHFSLEPEQLALIESAKKYLAKRLAS